MLSWLAYIWIIPDNWYGGGGTVGNRYFLNLLPAFLFLVPVAPGAVGGRGRGRWRRPSSSPRCSSRRSQHSLRPGDHATRAAFKVLPAELTMLNDLSVFTETWRKKRPFGFVGNPERPADPDAYFLYFLDDGTFGKEEWAGRDGLLAARRRVGRGGAARLRPRPGRARRPAGRRRAARRHGDAPASAGAPGGSRWARARWREIELPAGRGLRYYDTYLHVLRLALAPRARRSPTAAWSARSWTRAS